MLSFPVRTPFHRTDVLPALEELAGLLTRMAKYLH